MLAAVAGSSTLSHAISLVSSATTYQSVAAQSIDFTLPAAEGGDVYFVICASDNDHDEAATTIEPGWTLDYLRASGAGNDRTLIAAHKVVTGSEGSTANISHTQAADQLHAYCFALRGVDVSNPVSSAQQSAGATSSTQDSNDGLMTANAGDWAFYALVGQTASILSLTVPSGSTERLAMTTVGVDSYGVASELLTGNPGTGTWTLGASTNRTVQGTFIVNAAAS